MKRTLLAMLVMVALVACTKSEVKPQPAPEPEPPVQTEAKITIDVDESRLTAYQVVYSIYPEDKEAYYYCDVMSKARWESANLNEVKAEFNTALRNYAQMIDATYEEVCEQMLFKGDIIDFISNAGYRLRHLLVLLG